MVFLLFLRFTTKFMKKYYVLSILLVLFIFIIISCSKSDEEEEYVAISPVVVDLSTVPYTKLSDYHFFDGDLKNLNPSLNVLPYEPASSLFADYAHKKRFVWLPTGTKATYNGDDNVLEFPIGSVLIKTFFYTNVLPSNTTKIIETRLLIRKSTGWKAYDYVWNEQQTEANLEATNDGVFVPITFIENNVTRSTTYKIPSQSECLTCHKINPSQTGEITIPIGPKPQNLNTTFNYSTGSQNQLAKWRSVGFIGNDVPTNINSTIDYKDTSKSLEQRARSYIDINCAHCHRDGGHCDYTPQRFNYSNTNMNTFGLCLEPLFAIEGAPYVIKSGDANRSEIMKRINTTEGELKMPIIGRNLIHEEGVQLMTQYINSLPQTCN